jgi:hypothetical protein
MKKDIASTNYFIGDIFTKFSLYNKIHFYLKTDPKFYFDYQKINLESKITNDLDKNRQTQLVIIIEEAEKRRLQFMIDSLQNINQNNKSIDELIKEYSKLSQKFNTEIIKLERQKKEKATLSLIDNPDYKSMSNNFEKMEKLKQKK